MNASTTSIPEFNATVLCPANIPYARDILNSNLAPWLRATLASLAICCALSVVIFVDEFLFLRKNFRKTDRLHRTIWILAVFPVFSLTSFLSILVPRSGTLINLVANTFFATVIYQLVELIVDYLGGRDKMWIMIGEKRLISLRTPPLCCCCVCLPEITLTRKTFEKFYSLVVQVTVVRPLLMFIAAVLWTDNMYVPGNILPSNAFLYIAMGSLVSTLLAVWGLVVLKTAFRPELDQQFQMTGKIGCIQLTLISTSVASILCGILATTNIIRCTEALGARARGDVVFHAVVVVLMCLLGFVGRFFYRRADDGDDNACFEETVNIAASICVDEDDDVKADDVKNDVKDDVKNDVKDDVKNDVKNDVKDDVKNDVKDDVKNDVKDGRGGATIKLSDVNSNDVNSNDVSSNDVGSNDVGSNDVGSNDVSAKRVDSRKGIANEATDGAPTELV